MKKVLIMTLILTLALTSVIFAAPGDSNDPIVVLSYLEDRLDDLIAKYNLDDIDKIKDQVDKLSKGEVKGKDDSESSTSPKSDSNALEIVEIHQGEKLILGAGAELILRGGKASVIASDLGGLSNVTLGKDFVAGMDLVPNNLFIIPRDDGRGAYTDSYAIFMVRGTYEIK